MAGSRRGRPSSAVSMKVVITAVRVLGLLIGTRKCWATGLKCRDDPAYFSPSSGLSCEAHHQWLSSPSSNGRDDASASRQDCVSKWLDGAKKTNIHKICDATSPSIVECLIVYAYTEDEILDVQKHCPKACRSLCDGSNASVPSTAPSVLLKPVPLTKDNSDEYQTEAPSVMPTVGDASESIVTRVNSSILHLIESTEQSLDPQREEAGFSRQILIIIGYVTASISALGMIGCTVVSLWRRIQDKVDQKRRKQKSRRRWRRRRRRDRDNRRDRNRNHRSHCSHHRSTRKRHRDSIERDIYHKDNRNSNGIGQLRINVDHHEADRNKPSDNTVDCVLSIRLPAWCDEDLDHELTWDYDIEQGVRHDDEFQENEQLDSKARMKEDGSTMFPWFGDATNSIIQPKRGSRRREAIMPDDLSLTPRPANPGRGRRTKRKLNN